MTTFAVTSSNQLLPAVNYLLSNLDTTGSGNVVLPGNVLVVNTTTGVISQQGNATPVAYLYQYINLRYSNNATGTAGFDTNSNNYSYFGVYNNASSSPSANPTAYQWYEVSPPFDTATSRTLYYSAIGGRQIVFAAASSPPNTSYQVTAANVAIDLDVVTTATGTPGDRGPIALAFVITTADPNTATAAQLTTWFSASRENTVPPIGTGLTPVVGDTATFTYTAGVGQPSATLTYNGSIWIPVTGQVVNGNVIITGTLAGNAIISNTITATQIAASTITATQIAANTITANNIATGTITATQIAANTITATQIAANTITGNNIAAGTITASDIQTGTLTTNLFTANTINANILQANTFTANTINGNSIIANTFAANTINGTSIVAGSITTDKLAANVLTANTVISTGAIIGNFASPGFWLQGTTGSARFGNTISIGNNLTVGNNATIGGNLTVSGLTTGGNLNANTVATTTIQPAAISAGISASAVSAAIILNPVQGTKYASPTSSTITTTQANQPVYVWAQLTSQWYYQNVTSPTTVLQTFVYLERVFGNVVTTLFTESPVDTVFWSSGTFPTAFVNTSIFAGFVDNVVNPGTYTYRVSVAWTKPVGSGSYNIDELAFFQRSVLTQTLKR
jgi:hypothetical protein